MKSRLEHLREKYKEPEQLDSLPWEDTRPSRMSGGIARRYQYNAINPGNRRMVMDGTILWRPRPQYEQKESEYGKPSFPIAS